jgi:hypothetical protein
MKATASKVGAQFSLYRSSLIPWLTLPHEEQQKVAAALELEVLQKRFTPLDGRAVIVENHPRADQKGHQPLARHSRPGDMIVLDSPQEIAGFAAYRRTMDLILNDLADRAFRRGARLRSDSGSCQAC